MIRKLFFISIVFLFLTLPVFAQTVKWQDLRNNMDSWASGPVRLLMTDDEKDVWKKLKTPEEKLQFVRIFWARRDPILRTRENEYKADFYERLAHANKNFAEGKVPGWETARGQVYLLFGRPSREEKRLLPESSRPALLWVYDKIPAKNFPKNEALLFLYKDGRYILNPPNASPGDSIAQQQREIETGLTYQAIPSLVQQAFVETAKVNIIDESRNYDPLLFSVKTTEKFSLSDLPFDLQLKEKNPARVTVLLDPQKAPVYDDQSGKYFAEFVFKQEAKAGDRVVAANEHTVSYSWDGPAFADLTELRVDLPSLDPSGGDSISVTMIDRISNVAATQTVQLR